MTNTKIIGYTAGAFDLFHVGHLNLLRNSRSMCDHLIVGVSTDDLILEMKKKKPIISYAERIEIVGAVKYVDTVVPQIDVNKIAAWERYKFHIMFSGDDWKGTDRWLQIEKNLASVDVKLVYFPYTRHTSSSILRIALKYLEETEFSL